MVLGVLVGVKPYNTNSVYIHKSKKVYMGVYVARQYILQ